MTHKSIHRKGFETTATVFQWYKRTQMWVASIIDSRLKGHRTKWGPCYLATFNLFSTTSTCDQAKCELTVYISIIQCGILMFRYKIRNITLMHISPCICPINESQKRTKIHQICSIFNMFQPIRQTSWTEISKHTKKVINSPYTNATFPSRRGATAKNGPRPPCIFWGF